MVRADDLADGAWHLGAVCRSGASQRRATLHRRNSILQSFQRKPSEDCFSKGLSWATGMAVVGVPVGFFHAHEAMKVGCCLLPRAAQRLRGPAGSHAACALRPSSPPPPSPALARCCDAAPPPVRQPAVAGQLLASHSEGCTAGAYSHAGGRNQQDCGGTQQTPAARHPAPTTARSSFLQMLPIHEKNHPLRNAARATGILVKPMATFAAIGFAFAAADCTMRNYMGRDDTLTGAARSGPAAPPSARPPPPPHTHTRIRRTLQGAGLASPVHNACSAAAVAAHQLAGRSALVELAPPAGGVPWLRPPSGRACLPACRRGGRPGGRRRGWPQAQLPGIGHWIRGPVCRWARACAWLARRSWWCGAQPGARHPQHLPRACTAGLVVRRSAGRTPPATPAQGLPCPTCRPAPNSLPLRHPATQPALPPAPGPSTPPHTHTPGVGSLVPHTACTPRPACTPCPTSRTGAWWFLDAHPRMCAGAMLVTDFVDRILHPVMDEIKVTGPLPEAGS